MQNNTTDRPTPITTAHMKTLPFGWDYFDYETERKMGQLERELAELQEHVNLCHDAIGECCGSDTSELYKYFDNMRTLIERVRIAEAERDNAISDHKQCDIDCVRALAERNEARKELAETKERLARVTAQSDVYAERLTRLAGELAVCMYELNELRLDNSDTTT